MITAAFEYARPGSVDEAQALLNKFGEDAKVIAGGQSLIPLMRLRLSHRPRSLIFKGSASSSRSVATTGALRSERWCATSISSAAQRCAKTSRFSWRWPTTWATTRCATSEPSAA